MTPCSTASKRACRLTSQRLCDVLCNSIVSVCNLEKRGVHCPVLRSVCVLGYEHPFPVRSYDVLIVTGYLYLGAYCSIVLFALVCIGGPTSPCPSRKNAAMSTV